MQQGLRGVVSQLVCKARVESSKRFTPFYNQRAPRNQILRPELYANFQKRKPVSQNPDPPPGVISAVAQAAVTAGCVTRHSLSLCKPKSLELHLLSESKTQDCIAISTGEFYSFVHFRILRAQARKPRI